MRKFYDVLKLNNGFRIAYSRRRSQITVARLSVRFGPIDEFPHEEGLAHLVEHVVSASGPRTMTRAAVRGIEARFPEANAESDIHKTTFTCESLGKDIADYLRFIKGCVLNPGFPTWAINEEKARVLLEFAEDHGDPNNRDAQRFNRSFYGKNSPHARDIVGKRPIIHTATRKNLVQFHSRGYLLQNMELVLVGAVSNELLKVASNLFETCDAKKERKKQYCFPPPRRLTSPRVIVTPAPELYDPSAPKESTGELLLGIQGPSEQEHYSPAVHLMAKILGGGGSSLLYRELSQRRGLSYSIGSYHNPTRNDGGLFVQGGLRAVDSEESIDKIFGIFRALRQRRVHHELLDCAKAAARLDFCMALDNNSARAEIIEDELDGSNVLGHERKVQSVTRNDLIDAANRYLPTSDGPYVILFRDPHK